MTLIIVEPPAVEPVDIEDIKQHLGQTLSVDDTLLDLSLIPL